MRIRLAANALCAFAFLWAAAPSFAQVDEKAKLVSPSGSPGDQAGLAVSLSGDFAAIGIPNDGTLGIAAGSVELFRFDGVEWNHFQTLTAEDGTAGDWFGYALELSGDLLVVGAFAAQDSTGAAYVFRYDGVEWIEEQKLIASNGIPGDVFGASVSVDQDAIAVATTGKQANSVYVYRFDGVEWFEEMILVPTAGSSGEVGIRGDVLIAGSQFFEGIGTNSGAATVFRNGPTGWIEEQRLVPSDVSGGDRCGRQLRLDASGTVAVISAWLDDDFGTDSGAAYVFRFDGSTWVEEQKLTAPQLEPNDRLGSAVSIDGDMIALGAPFHDGGASDRGATFIYHFDGLAWTMDQRLIPSDGDASDYFGTGVAVDLGRVLVGATRAATASGATGAAYFFAITDCNGNGIADAADIAAGTAFDCNQNLIPDACDIAAGESPDLVPPQWSGVFDPIVVGHDPGVCGALVFWTPPVAIDDCSIAPVFSSHEPGDFFPLGTTVVSFSATDAAGNSIVRSSTITVEDREGPNLADVPADIVVSAPVGSCEELVSFTAPTATDPCSNAVLTLDRTSGELFEVGTTIVTCTAIDEAGNSTVESFSVTVIDNTPPEISSAPGDLTQGCDPGVAFATVSWPMPIVVDSCGSAILEANPSGSQFPLGTTTVELSATDLAGNRTTIEFTITVIDTEPPQFQSSFPQGWSVPLPAVGCSAPVPDLTPTVTDNSGSAELFTPKLPATLPVGTHSFDFVAIDPAGNHGIWTAVVTVFDATPPVLALNPSVTVPVDSGECGAIVTLNVTALDCSLLSLINDHTQTGSRTSFFPIGTTIVTWTAQDFAGNQTIATQEVTVTVPEVDCNGNGTPDHCDIVAGLASDANGNGVLDGCEIPFIRGDASGNLALEITDAIAILQILFSPTGETTCLDAADTNADGQVDLGDAIRLLTMIFAGGAPLAAPSPECGLPTWAPLGCDLSACAL